MTSIHLPAITRLPLGDVPFFLAGLRSGRYSTRRLGTPVPGIQSLRDGNDQALWKATLRAGTDMTAAPRLPSRIREVYGLPDGLRVTRAGNVEVFAFVVGGETVWISHHPGTPYPDMSLNWTWLVPEGVSLPVVNTLPVDTPQIRHFWPAFLYTFGPTLGFSPMPLEAMGESGLLLKASLEEEKLAHALPHAVSEKSRELRRI